MSRGNSAALDGRLDRFSLSAFVWRQITGLAGFALFLLLALAVAALATWNVMDPSYSYATGNAPTNILGYGGAAFALVFTLTRLAILCLLAALVVLFGRSYMERTADHAATETVKAGAIGFVRHHRSPVHLAKRTVEARKARAPTARKIDDINGKAQKYQFPPRFQFPIQPGGGNQR